MPVQIMITRAGLDALVNAQNGATEAIKIVQIGITSTAFLMAPTVTSLPGEIKRIDAVSGIATSENIIHMTGQDVSEDVYDVRGIGLYLEDGSLFGIFAQPTPVFRKVSISFFLFALDLAFQQAVAENITFGDTSFLMPPASETVKGVAEIATPAEAAARFDHERIITALTLGLELLAERATTDADLTALADGFDTILAGLMARTITGGGLVSGGGNLTASRILTVLAASAADIVTGTATDRAVTPAALSGLGRSLTQNGWAILPGLGGLILQWGRFTAAANGNTTTLFPIAFPTECFAVAGWGGSGGGNDSQDNPPVLLTAGIERSGFPVFSADDSAGGCAYIALGV
ncbi:MAG: hypothetical protein V4523_05030 [Pseudomonadota bacterium]